jgi:DNA-binding response OmpR family regulator
VRILLVEDNPDDEALARRALKKNGMDQGLVVARDGVEALDYLHGTGSYEGRDTTEQPALVLLDLKLPRLNGLEVLKRLREDRRTRLLPVVLLTSSDDEKDRIDGYDLGANSYVRKPLDFGEFTEAVRQLGQYWLKTNLAPPKLYGAGGGS